MPTETAKRLRAQRRIFLTLNTVAAVAMAILFYFVVHQQHQITHQTATIQQERIDSLTRQCKDQNARHSHTLATLNQLIAGLPPTQRVTAKRSKHFTILLIDALAPIQNCAKIVEQSVPYSSP